MENEKLKIIYSQNNIEIQRILEAFHRRRPVLAKSTAGEHDASTEMSQAPQMASNRLVRSVKSVVNTCGTAFGLGDELTTIAIKS